MKRITRKLTLSLVALLLGTITGAASPEQAARGVLTRVMGESAVEKISLESIPKQEGLDVYSYWAKNGKLTIEGSSSVAMCRAAYDYIREKNLGTVGWAGARLNLATILPDAPLKKGKTPFKIRHCYNVCTFGYTMPYWTWDRWQQELDWLAMHGYNMIMNPVATEAIGTRVWKKIGLTQKEIDEYYVGPAHLPWNRMGNIRNMSGKLHANWHKDQVELQHKLLKRMRELDIEPVIQGFAGFVPPAIKRIYPNLVLHNTHWNGGIPVDSRPVVMMPDDPLFAKITKAYLSEWKKEFGTPKYVLVDSFNEMQLPETSTPKTELLANYGKKTYEAIKSELPDAVWTLQGWMFNYQRYIWNKDTVKALLGAVPDDRLLILDYANDYNPNWDEFSGFHGKTWVMGYVPNMGGKTAYTGKMDFYANQVARTLKHKGKGNLVGFTISGEGLENNEVLYELLSDTAWNSEAIDVSSWLKKYSTNRYASDSKVLQAAWNDLHKSVYSSFVDHPQFGWQILSLNKGRVYSDPKFTAAVQKFLSVAGEHENNANYTDDAVEMAALSLCLRAEEYFVLTQKAISIGNIEASKEAAAQANTLLLQADRLLESHSLNRLDRWIALAREHQGTKREKDGYETNARRIITVWGPPVNDYACRVWSGLIRDFYAPRMQAKLTSMWGEGSFNRHQWEDNWVTAQGVSKIDPYQNPAQEAAKLVASAYSTELPSIEADKGIILGLWTPGQIKTEWSVVEWNLTAEQLQKLEAVRFVFNKGSHRLDIKSVEVDADGTVVAKDEHLGTAGDKHQNNTYRFKIPATAKGNNGCKIRATVKGTGGTVSYGSVILELKK